MDTVTLRIGKEDWDVFTPDGGVATIRQPNGYVTVELYQDRIKPEELENESQMWESLGEGKMYCKDYIDLEEVTMEVLADTIGWLGFNINNVNLVIMHSEFLVTSEDVKQVAKDLKIELEEDQIARVIAHYPYAQENDPQGLWCQIIEQCFYELDFLP